MPCSTSTIRLPRQRGYDHALGGAPGGALLDAPPVHEVAVLGADHPGTRPEVLVQPGSQVRAGEPLWRDRRNSALQVLAPAGGEVVAVHMGARRRLQAIVVACADVADAPAPLTDQPPDSAAAVRDLLQRGGLWGALRTRPFHTAPAAAAQPQRIVVLATRRDPLAPPPASLLADAAPEVRAGLAALDLLGPSLVLFADADTNLPADLPEGTRGALADGPWPNGLAGTHLGTLLGSTTPGPGHWFIGLQDVIALGRLCRGAASAGPRVVAIAGPAANPPRLLRVPAGAAIRDLLADSESGADCRAGPPLLTRGPTPATAYLGAHEDQLTLTEPAQPQRARQLWQVLRRPTAVLPSAATAGGSVVADERAEALWPFPTPLGPLLRALRTDDLDTAAALGCQALVAEDLALASALCPNGNAYGADLARVQHALEGTA